MGRGIKPVKLGKKPLEGFPKARKIGLYRLAHKEKSLRMFEAAKPYAASHGNNGGAGFVGEPHGAALQLPKRARGAELALRENGYGLPRLQPL